VVTGREDLHLVENLIVNKEGRMPDIGYFLGYPEPVSTPATVVVHDQEFHTSYWGHVGLLGLEDHVLLPGYAAYANTAAASLVPTNAQVLDLAHAQGGVTGYVHPFDTDPAPGDFTTPLTAEFPVDVALGKVDYYEALGLAGRSFATNGPLLEFGMENRGVGQELALPAGAHEVMAHVSLRSNVPVDHLEIIGNGEVVREVPLTGDRTRTSVDMRLPVRRSGWFLLRARTDHAVSPVLDLYPYATTSPVYVIVGGQPIRSAGDAEYFMAWIDRLAAGVKVHTGWNGKAEQGAVLAMLAKARAEFERRK
jgi:TolB protein